MGYTKHHAIVVTSFDNALINKAHEQARLIFGSQATNIIIAPCNGYASFFIGPDGSNDGWNESHEGDNRRAAFIEWVTQQAYDDGSNAISYAELFYGDGNKESEVVKHN